MTSDAASSASGTQSWRRGPREPKNKSAAPTGVKAMGWGRKRNTTAKRMNTYASMGHLGRDSILGVRGAGVKRGSAARLIFIDNDEECSQVGSQKSKVRSQKSKVRSQKSNSPL